MSSCFWSCSSLSKVFIRNDFSDEFRAKIWFNSQCFDFIFDSFFSIWDSYCSRIGRIMLSVMWKLSWQEISCFSSSDSLSTIMQSRLLSSSERI